MKRVPKPLHKQRFALLSVFDKTGIVDIAHRLKSEGYQIISTGGTAKILTENKIDTIPIQEVTGNPECFDGRMKTISFQIESGILFDRSKKTHRDEAKNLNIKPIDIVVCNLYPFENTISKRNTTLMEAIEQIDIGGPTMVRAAAKNFKHVLVLTDPNDYKKVNSFSETTESLRRELAAKAFTHLSLYDSQIAMFLSKDIFPLELTLPLRKSSNLRYGENPHQSSAFYLYPQNNSPFSRLKKHWGRELSLTNLTDISSGIESVRMFTEPCAVVIKHNNPCGIALASTTGESLMRAINADPESAFGGTIVVNKKIDDKIFRVVQKFVREGRGNFDILSGPAIDKKALKDLSTVRKSMGIYTFGKIAKKRKEDINIKWLDGGLAIQTLDNPEKISSKNWKIATKIKPSKKDLEQMEIAWKFISRIKSNSILIMDRNLPMTRGIGSGQTSRIRSAKIAFEQAGEHARGAILASDSFFPFDDIVRLAVKHAVKAIVQQGGSINDKASIEACNKAGIAMVFTGQRAFWH